MVAVIVPAIARLTFRANRLPDYDAGHATLELPCAKVVGIANKGPEYRHRNRANIAAQGVEGENSLYVSWVDKVNQDGDGCGNKTNVNI
jgi:hypothetical protein